MPGQSKHFYEFGAFRVDAAEHLLLRDGERVPLAPMVFNLLLVLIKHPGQALERAWLKEQVWGDAKIGDPDDHVLANLNVYIATLRKALGDDSHQPQYIETIPRNGYRFIAEVREWEEEEVEKVNGAQAEVQTVKKSRRRFLQLITPGMILVGAVVAGSYFFKSYYTPPPKQYPPTSVAVLPFKLLNDNERDRPLEKGMAATLIPRLGNINEIRVLHLDKVRGYFDRDQDPAEVGRGLQVDLVLTGDIQSVNNSVRVIMQLIRVSDEQQVWSDTFTEKFTDLLSVQDSISDQAIAELTQQLRMMRYTENVEVSDPYRK